MRDLDRVVHYGPRRVGSFHHPGAEGGEMMDDDETGIWIDEIVSVRSGGVETYRRIVRLNSGIELEYDLGSTAPFEPRA